MGVWAVASLTSSHGCVKIVRQARVLELSTYLCLGGRGFGVPRHVVVFVFTCSVALVFGGTGLTIERFGALLNIYNCKSRLGSKLATV